jgi:hypothetical protein
MKWYIYGAILAGFILVGTFMIEGLAILRLHKASNSERDMWLTVQDKLKFLAAPSGTVIMALLIYALLEFSNWSQVDALSMYCIIASFLIVIVISSVWIPRRFKRVGILLKDASNPAPTLDTTLVILWTIRTLLFVGIITAIVGLM